MGTSCLQPCDPSTIHASGIEVNEMPHNPIPPKTEEQTPPNAIKIHASQKSHLEISQKQPKELLEDCNFEIKAQGQLISRNQMPFLRGLLNNCGNIILRTDGKRNSVKKILANGILIAKDLVLTTSTCIINGKDQLYCKDISFLSYFNEREYQVVKMFGKSTKAIISASQYQDNHLFLRLRSEIKNEEFSPSILTYDCPREIQNAYSLAVEWKQSQFKIHYDQIKLSFDQDAKLVRYRGCHNQLHCGGPLIIKRFDHFVIIGLQSKIDQESQSTLGLIFKFSLNNKLRCQTPQEDKKKIMMLPFDKRKPMSFSMLQQQEPKIGADPDEDFSLQCFRNRLMEPIFSPPPYSLQVKDTLLRYVLFKPDNIYTIERLCQQYKEKTNEQLIVSARGISLPREMPIQPIMLGQAKCQSFERLLNQLNSPGFNIKQAENSYIQHVNLQIMKFKHKKQKQGINDILVKIIKKDNLIHTFFHKKMTNQTISDLIRSIKRLYNYSFSNYKMVNKYSEQIIDPSNNINTIKGDQISFIFLDFQGYISSNSRVQFCKGTIQFQSSQTQIESLMRNKNDISLLSYEQLDKSFTFHKIVQVYKQNTIKQTYLLTYADQLGSHMLQCSDNTLFKHSKQNWIMAKNLKIGEKILGVKQGGKRLGQYQIIKIQKLSKRDNRLFCSFQIQKTHNYIANFLVIHNHNPFEVQVLYYEGGIQRNRTYQKVYADQLISEKFRNLKVFVGNFELDQRLTYGDYDLYQFVQLHITRIEDKKPICSDILRVTKWRRQTKELPPGQDQIYQLDKQYYGFYNRSFHRLDQKFINNLRNKKIPQIILHQKMFSKRMIFYSKTIDFQRCQQEIERKYNIIQKSYKNKKIRQSFKDVLPKAYGIAIHLYIGDIYHTHDYIRINRYLRRTDPLQMKESDQQFQIAKIMCRALENMQVLEKETLVFRGLYLKQDEPFLISDNIILFPSFTSTSTAASIGQRFLKMQKGNTFLRIKTISGRILFKDNYERQILIPPFTYFLIENKQYEKGILQMNLRQIPLPFRLEKNIIIWYSDCQQMSYETFQQINSFNRSKRAQFEPVFVTSSQILKFTLKFMGTYTFLGKKIVFIRDFASRSNINEFNAYCQKLGFSSSIFLRSQEITLNLCRAKSYYNQNQLAFSLIIP